MIPRLNRKAHHDPLTILSRDKGMGRKIGGNSFDKPGIDDLLKSFPILTIEFFLKVKTTSIKMLSK